MIELKTRLRVNVTHDDIHRGTQNSPTRCAIVRAINRQHPKYVYVTVGERSIGLTDKERRVRYEIQTPPNARKLIQQFDAGDYSKTLRFEIRLAKAQVYQLPDTTALRVKRRAVMANYKPRRCNGASKRSRRQLRRVG